MNTNSFDFSLYNNKLQDSTVFSYTYYSMTLNPSGFCSNKSDIASALIVEPLDLLLQLLQIL